MRRSIFKVTILSVAFMLENGRKFNRKSNRQCNFAQRNFFTQSGVIHVVISFVSFEAYFVLFVTNFVQKGTIIVSEHFLIAIPR